MEIFERKNQLTLSAISKNPGIFTKEGADADSLSKAEILALTSQRIIFQHLFGLSENEAGSVDAEVLSHNYIEYWCSSWGIENGNKERLFKQSMELANKVISVFTHEESGLLHEYRETISHLNIIEVTNEPGDLLLMLVNPRVSMRQQFEAYRKLELANVALSLLSANTERKSTGMKKLLQILDNVWEGEVGEIHAKYFQADHSYVHYGVENVVEVFPGDDIKIGDYKRLYTLMMRRFVDSIGNEHSVMIDHREKQEASALLKLLRKDTHNPNEITDSNGIKMVFTSENDIKAFVSTLHSFLLKGNHALQLADISYSIGHSSAFNGNNIGSSKNLEIAKTIVRIDGDEYELIFHTISTYLDSKYKDEVSHEEYFIKRLFSSGVVELLFPKSLYGTQHLEALEEIIADVTTKKVMRDHHLPPEFGSKRFKRYSDRDFARDVITITEQSQQEEFKPEYVIVADDQAVLLGVTLAKIHNNARMVMSSDEIVKTLDSSKCLIVANVCRTGETLAHVLEKLPKAKVAALIVQNGKDRVKVDYTGQRIDDLSIWFNFFFDSMQSH